MLRDTLKCLPINCKINPDADTLNKYHIIYKWIPDENMIRPSHDDLNKKVELFSILEMYNSKIDYIAINIFKIKSKINHDNGKICSKFDIKENCMKMFLPNLFKYNIPEGNHYIMWYSYKNLSDDEITNDIYNSLTKICEFSNFKFVWYINPKMTFPEVFHVQVFWSLVK